eukprot:3281316-Pyramimonas_sp.AAC.1
MRPRHSKLPPPPNPCRRQRCHPRAPTTSTCQWRAAGRRRPGDAWRTCSRAKTCTGTSGSQRPAGEMDDASTRRRHAPP